MSFFGKRHRMKISLSLLLIVTLFGFAKQSDAQNLNSTTDDPFGPNLGARLAYASGDFIWDPQTSTLISQSIRRDEKRDTVTQLLANRELVVGFKRTHLQKVHSLWCDSLAALLRDCRAAADKFPASLAVTQASFISKSSRSVAKR